MNTRRGEEIRREGERGERGRRGGRGRGRGRGRREGSRASICPTATGRCYMICCAHFSILASVSLDTLPDLIADIQSGGLYDCFHHLFSLLSQEQVLVVKRGRGRIT